MRTNRGWQAVCRIRVVGPSSKAARCSDRTVLSRTVWTTNTNNNYTSSVNDPPTKENMKVHVRIIDRTYPLRKIAIRDWAETSHGNCENWAQHRAEVPSVQYSENIGEPVRIRRQDIRRSDLWVRAPKSRSQGRQDHYEVALHGVGSETTTRTCDNHHQQDGRHEARRSNVNDLSRTGQAQTSSKNTSDTSETWMIASAASVERTIGCITLRGRKKNAVNTKANSLRSVSFPNRCEVKKI